MATLPHHEIDDEDAPVPHEQPVEPEMDVGMPAAAEEENEAQHVPK